MRQILLAPALSALASNADAASRIPAPATTAIQLVGGFGHGTRPPEAQIAPTQGD